MPAGCGYVMFHWFESVLNPSELTSVGATVFIACEKNLERHAIINVILCFCSFPAASVPGRVLTANTLSLVPAFVSEYFLD